MTTASLIDAARALVGRPWRDHGASPDEGFDCVGVLIYLAKTFGRLPDDWRPPEYRLHGGFAGRELMLEVFAALGMTRRDGDPEPGDVVTFRVPGTVWHAGLCVGDGAFVHAMPRYGVRMSRLSESTWRRRFAGAWMVHWR